MTEKVRVRPLSDRLLDGLAADLEGAPPECELLAASLKAEQIRRSGTGFGYGGFGALRYGMAPPRSTQRPAAVEVEVDSAPPRSGAKSEAMPITARCNLDHLDFDFRRGGSSYQQVTLDAGQREVLLRILAPSGDQDSPSEVVVHAAVRNVTTEQCNSWSARAHSGRHPSITLETDADYMKLGGTTETVYRHDSLHCAEPVPGKREGSHYSLQAPSIATDQSKLRKRKGYFLTPHWPEHIDPNTYHFTARACGNPQGEEPAVAELTARVEAYPDDRYYLRCVIPALVAVGRHAGDGPGETWKESDQLEAKLGGAKVTWENGEAKPTAEWKPTIAVYRNQGRNDEEHGAEDMPACFRFVDYVCELIKGIDDAVKYIQDALPKVGWWFRPAITVCQGRIEGCWGWKQRSPPRQGALRDVGFGQSWDIALDIIKGSIAWGVGIKHSPKLLAHTNISAQIFLELTFTADCHLEQRFQDPDRLLRAEKTDRFDYAAVLEAAEASPCDRLGRGRDHILALKLEARLLLGHPLITDIRFWTRSSLSSGTAVAVNRRILDEITLDAEKPLGPDDRAELTATDDGQALSEENKRVTLSEETQTRDHDVPNDGRPIDEVEVHIKTAYRFKGLAVYGYVSLLGKTVFGQKGGGATATREKSVMKAKKALEASKDSLKTLLRANQGAGRTRANRRIRIQGQIDERDRQIGSFDRDLEALRKHDAGIEPLAQPLKPCAPVVKIMSLSEFTKQDHNRQEEYQRDRCQIALDDPPASADTASAEPTL